MKLSLVLSNFVVCVCVLGVLAISEKHQELAEEVLFGGPAKVSQTASHSGSCQTWSLAQVKTRSSDNLHESGPHSCLSGIMVQYSPHVVFN